MVMAFKKREGVNNIMTQLFSMILLIVAFTISTGFSTYNAPTEGKQVYTYTNVQKYEDQNFQKLLEKLFGNGQEDKAETTKQPEQNVQEDKPESAKQPEENSQAEKT